MAKKKEVKKEIKKNNKMLYIGLGSLGAVALIIIIVLLVTKPNINLFSTEPRVDIVLNESKKIEYEDYDNGLISLKIPKGWKVEVAPVDYIHYTFKVYNPSNEAYMLLFDLKQEGFLKTEKARKVMASYYPDSVFAKLAAIEPQTTEAFFKVWNTNAKLANTIDIKYEFFPYFEEWTIIDNFGSSMLGGDILRATYKDTKGNLIQGLWTASVKSVGTYYINENIWNLRSAKVDVSPLNVYNIIIMTAPDEEFINYEEILNYSLSTLEFSQDFVNSFNKEESTLVATIQANQKIYDQITEGIMSSWEERNKTYDIISQKQSDATLGYERVYDTDTGEIYKATNGFMDNYSGTKYQSITDDMYNLPTAGYIEIK